MTSCAPNFVHFIVDHIIVIIDLDRGNQSVTNGIESVLDDIFENIGSMNIPIIYRDSDKIFSRVLVDDRQNFTGFAPICDPQPSTLNDALLSMHTILFFEYKN